jgi:hypothetical protein
MLRASGSCSDVVIPEHSPVPPRKLGRLYVPAHPRAREASQVATSTSLLSPQLNAGSLRTRPKTTPSLPRYLGARPEARNRGAPQECLIFCVKSKSARADTATVILVLEVIGLPWSSTMMQAYRDKECPNPPGGITAAVRHRQFTFDQNPE